MNPQDCHISIPITLPNCMPSFPILRPPWRCSAWICWSSWIATAGHSWAHAGRPRRAAAAVWILATSSKMTTKRSSEGAWKRGPDGWNDLCRLMVINDWLHNCLGTQLRNRSWAISDPARHVTFGPQSQLYFTVHFTNRKNNPRPQNRTGQQNGLTKKSK